MTKSAPKLLAGLKVVDLTRLVPGPKCTQIFSDLGADVIKVESTDGGDYARTLPPKLKKNSLLFAQLNRGKKSARLDLKNEKDKKKLRKLLKYTDVLVESFRPGVMAKLGFSYADVKKINKKIVYCSISGYGQHSSLKEKGGHDLNYLALSGVLDQIGGSAESAPGLSNLLIADTAAGTLLAATSILAGVLHARKTRVGCELDVSMLHGAFALQTMSHCATGSPTRGNQIFNGASPFYGVYKTKDNRYMALAALEEKFWDEFLRTIKRSDLKQLHRIKDADKLRQEISHTFGEHTQSEWAKIFSNVDVLYTRTHIY